MSEYKQTLITGFGPFGKVVSNPSGRLLKRFAGQVIGDQLITTCLLPVSFTQAPVFMDIALRAGGKNGAPFDHILMLGVADTETRWRVERCGRNANSQFADMDGTIPDAIIEREAPEILPSTLPSEALELALNAVNLPAYISENAGGYLCNFILFDTLWKLRQSGSNAKAGFLHVPADKQTFADEEANEKAFSFEDHMLALEAALTVLAPEFEGDQTSSEYSSEYTEFFID